MLRDYQYDAVEFLERHQRALLALPPGAGKTAIVSSWAGSLHGPMRALIVAPNGPVLHHWQHELIAWGGFPGMGGTGTPQRRAKAREIIAKATFGALVINYECMRNDIEELVKIPWDLVVFDESHRLKGRKITFKAAAKLAKAAPFLVLVTGTPVLNRSEELWTSLHLIDPKKYKSYWRWVEQRFTIRTPRYGGRLIRDIGAPKSPEHVKLMRDEIGQRMFYRPLSEILPDLPPVIETTYEVELSPAERRAHDSMAKDFWMEVGDDIIHAPNAIAKMTQLRKLGSDWSVFGEAPGTKVQAACQIVDDLDGEQCIVFCAFRATAEAAASIMPKALPYHGGMSPEARSLVIDGFKEGKVQTIVATIATLGEGVDGLQVARNAIFIDRDWTPARNEQAIGRLQRQGQKNAVNVTHIVAADTIDNVVADALTSKTDVIKAIIGSHRVSV